MDIDLRPVAHADIERLHRWLSEPHVADSYGLGNRPTREDVLRKYGPLSRGETPTRGYVVHVDGRPVGYAQTYRIGDYPEYAASIGVADESYGIDLFLGEARDLGRGWGPMVIRRLTTEIFEKTAACAVVADPPSTNGRSVRAFEKAGFVRWRTVVPASPGGGDLLLRLARPPAA